MEISIVLMNRTHPIRVTGNRVRVWRRTLRWNIHWNWNASMNGKLFFPHGKNPIAFTRPFRFAQAVKFSLIGFEMRRHFWGISKSFFFSVLFALVALRGYYKNKTHQRFWWAEKDIDRSETMENESARTLDSIWNTMTGPWCLPYEIPCDANFLFLRWGSTARGPASIYIDHYQMQVSRKGRLIN